MRSAFRKLAGSPLLTLAVLITLGLGVAANASVFSLFDYLKRQADYFGQPDKLFLLQGEQREMRRFDLLISEERLSIYEARQTSFSGLASSDLESFEASLSGDPFQVLGARVNVDFFRTLGVAPKLGRDFGAPESKANNSVVIGEDLWREKFGVPRECARDDNRPEWRALHHRRRSPFAVTLLARADTVVVAPRRRRGSGDRLAQDAAAASILSGRGTFEDRSDPRTSARRAACSAP